MNAVRKSQPKTYIPSALADYNPQTGEPLRPDPFEDSYITVAQNMAEDGKNQIVSVQPEINTEGYLSAYMTALDLCMQGLISPSTLGIDVKKLDNAEAQREKEKATLYTRNRIVTVLQKFCRSCSGQSCGHTTLNRTRTAEESKNLRAVGRIRKSKL